MYGLIFGGPVWTLELTSMILWGVPSNSGPSVAQDGETEAHRSHPAVFLWPSQLWRIGRAGHNLPSQVTACSPCRAQHQIHISSCRDPGCPQPLGAGRAVAGPSFVSTRSLPWDGLPRPRSQPHTAGPRSPEGELQPGRAVHMGGLGLEN